MAIRGSLDVRTAFGLDRDELDRGFRLTASPVGSPKPPESLTRFWGRVVKRKRRGEELTFYAPVVSASASATVARVSWDDGEGSQSVTFETTLGGSVTAFAFAEHFKQGETVAISLEPLDIDGDFDEVFAGNGRHESALEPLVDEWSYFAKGQVVGLEAGTMYIDCGGFIVHLDGMTNDPGVVGEWVGFRVSRMDVTRADGPPR